MGGPVKFYPTALEFIFKNKVTELMDSFLTPDGSQGVVALGLYPKNEILYQYPLENMKDFYFFDNEKVAVPKVNNMNLYSAMETKYNK
jgi:hypothetical protein